MYFFLCPVLLLFVTQTHSATNPVFRPFIQEQHSNRRPIAAKSSLFTSNQRPIHFSVATPKAASCGEIKPKITHLISNSKFTLHEIWPWNVQLIIQVNNPQRSKVFCGGTIISNSFILTAAHCFDELKHHERSYSTVIQFNSIFVDSKKTKLNLNAEYILEHPAYMRKNIPQNRLFYHPNLQSGPKHDLALVKFNLNRVNNEILRKSLNLQLNRICLPSVFGLNINEFTRCKILGQGFMNSYDEDEYRISDQLQYADVIISSNEQCRLNIDSNYVKEKINADTLCINGDVHPCLGDSGGSLICQQNDGKWYLTGVTSFAVSSSSRDKCGDFKSAVFVKVQNYMDWIRMHVQD